jgi:hypothetical protein
MIASNLRAPSATYVGHEKDLKTLFLPMAPVLINSFGATCGSQLSQALPKSLGLACTRDLPTLTI